MRTLGSREGRAVIIVIFFYGNTLWQFNASVFKNKIRVKEIYYPVIMYYK